MELLSFKNGHVFQTTLKVKVVLNLHNSVSRLTPSFYHVNIKYCESATVFSANENKHFSFQSVLLCLARQFSVFFFSSKA